MTSIPSASNNRADNGNGAPSKGNGAHSGNGSTPAPSTDSILDGINSPDDLKKLPVSALPQLASELRQSICDQVSITGGHLAPNLGVVELTIALHYTFDFSYDRLLFDVGHQCYPHKLLTGRQHLFTKLRQAGGMSGFPEPSESPYDLFAVGHAGTSISTAVGMARADQLNGEKDRHAVSLIGDASIVNGVAMEGLNNAGTLNRQFLVVLNDNGMSIANPQGAVANHFDRFRVSQSYNGMKKRAHQLLEKIPGGAKIEDVYHRLGEAAKAVIVDDHMFEQFGLVCVGPMDGHDIGNLIDILQAIKGLDRPILLHCKTIKGKGFDFSEGDATAFHSPKPFKVEGCRVEMKKSGRSFTSAFSDAMDDMMGRDEKVFAVTAAMPDGTGLTNVLKKYPERSLDTGICESHAMDMCAGMAKAGIKPFFAVYSTFSARALDQVFQEVALQGLPVRVCMDRAGYVGGDGAVHHGFMDIAMFRVFPEAVLLAPSDEQNLVAALEFMRTYDKGASFIRYPRDSVVANPIQDQVPAFEIGKANLVRPSKGKKPDLAILAYGAHVYEAIKAFDQLDVQGYDVALYDARFAKPIDIELVSDLVSQKIPVLTMEDHSLVSGFGSAVLEACNDHRVSTDLIYRMGMPERWIGPDTRARQLADASLDAAAIARMVRLILDDGNGGPKDNGSHAPVQNEDQIKATH
jgi:1-deoxy-D-xylulose-5-phosphate synthase